MLHDHSIDSKALSVDKLKSLINSNRGEAGNDAIVDDDFNQESELNEKDKQKLIEMNFIDFYFKDYLCSSLIDYIQRQATLLLYHRRYPSEQYLFRFNLPEINDTSRDLGLINEGDLNSYIKDLFDYEQHHAVFKFIVDPRVKDYYFNKSYSVDGGKLGNPTECKINIYQGK